MVEPRTPLHRRAFPWLLATVLVVLALMSVSRFLALRQELRAQVASQLEAQIADRVTVWEDALLDQLDDGLELAGEDPGNAWLTEAQMRQREVWLDSLYLWLPRRKVTFRGQLVEEPASFLFPLEPFSEAKSGVTRAPCIERARQAPLEQRAQSLLVECRREELAVRMYAASEAANDFESQGKPDLALRALESSGLDPSMHLQLAVRQYGLDPYRLGIQRIQRADYLMRLGNEEEALDLYYRTGLEITSLDAPEFTQLLSHVRTQIFKELNQHERPEQARRILQAIRQAERRRQAYDEIRQRILTRPRQPATESPRFIYDQYSQTPFLLYYGPVRNGDMGAALQVDQPMLLADFMGTMKRWRQHLVVTDAAGSRVAGAHYDGELAISVPFARTLTHLRVGLTKDALDARMASLDDQWIVPLVIIVVCVVLGGIALTAQIRADRSLQQLLVRQREFTARVTHELKTPLAGIRVMAENVESGAYTAPHQLKNMARSIIQEADRLTLRVDEILAVTRQRTVPEPEPFDPEEAVLEAIDMWGPRLDQAGVKFHADLHPTDPILGDSAAVRDAVGCLLDNALKYRNENRPDPQVGLTLHQDAGYVIIDVVDNGIGVPADMRDAIFERFVRVEGPNRGTAGGHGLGLAQVRETAEFHRGSVECLDGIDGGARFVLRLPAIEG